MIILGGIWFYSMAALGVICCFLGITLLYYIDYSVYMCVQAGGLTLFSLVIREDFHFGRICFKWVETTTWVQNTFEDDVKENVMLKRLIDRFIVSHQIGFHWTTG